MCVRWGNSISPDFFVDNGVKQGGIISPILFNIYMEDLSMHLNSFGLGGYLRTAFINHLCYADDLCLISLPSSECTNYYIFAIRMPRNINCYIMDLSHFLYVSKEKN